MGLAVLPFAARSGHDLHRAAKRFSNPPITAKAGRQISEDLTRNDKSKQKPSGGPITIDITSVEYYDTVFALAESPLKKGMLWAGTDDGLVHVTTDDGANWRR